MGSCFGAPYCRSKVAHEYSKQTRSVPSKALENILCQKKALHMKSLQTEARLRAQAIQAISPLRVKLDKILEDPWTDHWGVFLTALTIAARASQFTLGLWGEGKTEVGEDLNTPQIYWLPGWGKSYKLNLYVFSPSGKLLEASEVRRTDQGQES